MFTINLIQFTSIKIEITALLRFLAAMMATMASQTANLPIQSKIKPTTAQRCRSETENFILGDLFSTVLSQFKKYHPSENLKFNSLRIFRGSKFRFIMEKNRSYFS